MYEYSDQYFKNFKGTTPRNPRNPFNPPKILGETPFKEFTRKVAKPVLQTARGLATGPVGQVTAAGAGGYLLGTAVDQAYRAVPGSGGMPLSENIAEKIKPVNDGQYDPNRAPNPEFLEARAAMEQRGQDQLSQAKAIQDFSVMMDKATGSQTAIPYKNAGLGFSQEFFDQIKSEDPLNRVRGVSSFMETPRGGTGYTAEGKVVGDLTEPELRFLRERNEQRLIEETGFGQPVFASAQTQDTPFDLGNGTFGNEAARNQVDPRVPFSDLPTAPEDEPYPGYYNSPLYAMSQSLQAMGPNASADDRTAAAAAMTRPYMTTSHEDIMAKNDIIFANAAREAMAEREARETGSGVNDTEVQKTGLSMTDYRNLAKQELGRGAPNQAINARANQLQGEDERKREELESTKAYREGQLAKARNDALQREKEHSLNIIKYKDKQKELSTENALVKGNAAMSKLYNNQSLSDEDIPALLAYRTLMIKGGENDPLFDFNLDEFQTKELLYGSHKIYPSFTKEKDIDKKTARNLMSKGQDKVFRYGLLVDLRELIGEDISPVGESTSELPTTIEGMRNLVKIDDLKKQLKSASPRNRKSIQRNIDKLTEK